MSLYKRLKETPHQIGGILLSPFEKAEMEQRKKIYHSLKARARQKRSVAEKIADYVTQIFGSFTFLILNCIWFVVWILINTGALGTFISPFDPFPFGFLTMVVSLEAIALSIIVLITQNRGGRIDDLREEVHLQVNVIAEQEITKIIKMLSVLLEKNGVDISKDPELKKMLQRTDPAAIERRLEKEIE